MFILYFLLLIANVNAISILEKVNDYRVKHQVGPVKISSEINKIAQQWADYLATSKQFIHSGNGENIAMIPANVDASAAVDLWYGEEKKYNYSIGDFSPETGHFTALVWKSTQEIGVGIAKSGASQIVVMNFYPAGNVLGKFQENVFQPLVFQPPPPPLQHKISICLLQNTLNSNKTYNECFLGCNVNNDCEKYSWGDLPFTMWFDYKKNQRKDMRFKQCRYVYKYKFSCSDCFYKCNVDPLCDSFSWDDEYDFTRWDDYLFCES